MRVGKRHKTITVLTCIILTIVSGAGCGGTQATIAMPELPHSKLGIQPSPTKIPKDFPLNQPVSQATQISFVTPTHYETFPNDLQSAFKSAVDHEFAAAPEKAGISVAVYANHTLWTYATGEASATVEMTADTPMFISSTSKTFLSALILKQIESGLYNLTDQLGRVLANHPDFPSFAPDKINPEVTIQELLTMSSGLPDYSENTEGVGKAFSKPSWKPSDKINLVQSEYVEPGSFEYNDTNPALLGLIAEFYAGQSLADQYRRTFYAPLGIQALTLPEEGIPWHQGIFTDKAKEFTEPTIAFPYTDLSRWSSGFGNMILAAPFEFGYYLTGQGRIRWACCEIVSTPESIARWAYNLYSSNGSAISKSTRTALINSVSPHRVPPWNRPKTVPEEYGYFIAKKTFRLPNNTVISAYGHRGSGGGYSSWMHYSPELDLSISILANSDLKYKLGEEKFGGTCKLENPGNCISLSIFEAYSNILRTIVP